jgi:hypothetical protein
MRRSLAERGVIVMKESRVVARITTTHGGSLDIAGHIIAIIKNAERRITAGVRFENTETSRLGSAAFLDPDEVEEFLGALNFIISSAEQMARSTRDYTEVTFSTRDDFTIGFFQDGQAQQGIARLSAVHPFMGFRVTELNTIRGAVNQARDYVGNRRVSWEAR